MALIQAQHNQQMLQEVKDDKRFVIVSSRALTDDEIKTLNNHGTLAIYENRFESMSIPELFAQLQCRFLNIRIDQNKQYLQLHW